jgi:hypothetical protein
MSATKARRICSGCPFWIAMVTTGLVPGIDTHVHEPSSTIGHPLEEWSLP